MIQEVRFLLTTNLEANKVIVVNSACSLTKKHR